MSVPPSSSVNPAPLTAARTGLAELVVAGLLWGTGGLTGTLVGRVAHVSPLAVAGYRLSVGGLPLVGTGHRWPAGIGAVRPVAPFGALSALYQACYCAAVALTSIGLATLVALGAAPVLVLAVEAVTGRRRLDGRAVGTMALALAGLALLVGLPGGGPAGGVVLAGTGPATVSAACFAAITAHGARPVPGLGGLTTTGYGFLAGGAVLLVLAATTTGVAVRPDLTTVGLLAYLGIGPTAGRVRLVLPRAGVRRAAHGRRACVAGAPDRHAVGRAVARWADWTRLASSVRHCCAWRW